MEATLNLSHLFNNKRTETHNVPYDSYLYGLFNGINTFQIQCLDDVDFFERIKILQENLR